MKLKKHYLQAAIVICALTMASCFSESHENPSAVQPTVQSIQDRGKLLVGTTGDYRPLSYCEADGTLRQLHEKYGLVYGYEFETFSQELY